jgi:hypothetical protein
MPVAIFQRNSRGEWFGFPIDIRIPYTARSLSGRPFKSSWTLLAAGRNYWGDFVLIVCGTYFTLAEAASWGPSIGDDQC